MTLSSRWRDLTPEAVYQPRTSGRLVRMVGLTLEAIGIDVRTGDRCRVERPGGGDIEAEVVGFDGQRIFLMPIEQVDGLRPGALLVSSGDWRRGLGEVTIAKTSVRAPNDLTDVHG